MKAHCHNVKLFLAIKAQRFKPFFPRTCSYNVICFENLNKSSEFVASQKKQDICCVQGKEERQLHICNLTSHKPLLLVGSC